jgi:hypothetical protein
VGGGGVEDFSRGGSSVLRVPTKVQHIRENDIVYNIKQPPRLFSVARKEKREIEKKYTPCLDYEFPVLKFRLKKRTEKWGDLWRIKVATPTYILFFAFSFLFVLY